MGHDDDIPLLPSENAKRGWVVKIRGFRIKDRALLKDVALFKAALVMAYQG